ncbi:MAG: alpha/beta hydrolase [Caldilineaceae bacterium]|nr:alpha/beta hydrolase [Caldilineaceae bacterium]
MRDFAVSADGVLINYEMQEQRLPALLFVHGWSCDLNYWQKQFVYFASRYTVVAIDLGGHGDSGLNRDRWTMPLQNWANILNQLTIRFEQRFPI